MADRGITFSAPMVRALLDGRKSQTRRLFRPRGFRFYTHPNSGDRYEEFDRNGVTGCGPMHSFGWGDRLYAYLPHAPGDRLYVREHWKTSLAYDDLAPSEMGGEETVLYLADGALSEPHPDMPERLVGRHRQAMHMPRWASRLTLLVTDVRVQRLHDISREDAIAEGLIHKPGVIEPDWWMLPAPLHQGSFLSPVAAFAWIWRSLHSEPGTRWADNPWIYAVSFDVRQGNIDQIERAA